jgi:mevalonate kinase
MLIYSAPAKVILSGEHSVVYGKPAVASAIDLRMYVVVWDKKQSIEKTSVLKKIKKLRKKTEKIKLLSDVIPVDMVDKVFKLIKNYLKNNGVEILKDDPEFAVYSEIPVGRGLGSSAALSVAVIAALLQFYAGREYPAEVVNSLAYKIEKYFHKNPSGIDNSVACYGGLVYYRKEFEFLKQLASLNFKLCKKMEDSLFIIDTGIPEESTADMVSLVAKNYNADPESMDNVLSRVEKITKRMVVSIVKEDVEILKKSIIKSEDCLEELGIVSAKAKNILNELIPFGVGKVTGAGGIKEGSGYVLFYAEDTAGLKNYLDSKKILFMPFKQAKEGVRKEIVQY